MPGGEAFPLDRSAQTPCVSRATPHPRSHSSRVRANENEHMPDRPFFLETCLLVAPGHRVKALLEVTVKLLSVACEAQFDIRRGINTVRSVPRDQASPSSAPECSALRVQRAASVRRRRGVSSLPISYSVPLTFERRRVPTNLEAIARLVVREFAESGYSLEPVHMCRHSCVLTCRRLTR